MNITIHRGTNQIGGCVTEITSGNSRIFIDFGTELPGADGIAKEDSLSIPGLTEAPARCDGIFFTHTHGDHIGNIDRVLDDIPIHMGAAGLDLYQYLCEHLHNAGIDKGAALAALRRVTPFKAGKPIPAGKDIRVTPYFVDHSAYNAHMLLIEAEGLKVLHTGDFRSHGFVGKGLLKVLTRLVGQVDWLICEGTLLSRHVEKIDSERDLQLKAAALMRKHRKLFVICSSMNIDRIIGCVNAVPDDRIIVCDDFQRGVLDIVQRHAMPHTNFYDFSSVKSYDKSMITDMNRDGFLCFIRQNHFSEVLLSRHPDAVIAYAMWDGYLKGTTKNERLASLLEGRTWVDHHTSGHATSETLRMVCDTVKPRGGVIPIHTEKPGDFPALLEGYTVKCLSDKQTLSL